MGVWPGNEATLCGGVAWEQAWGCGLGTSYSVWGCGLGMRLLCVGVWPGNEATHSRS